MDGNGSNATHLDQHLSNSATASASDPAVDTSAATTAPASASSTGTPSNGTARTTRSKARTSISNPPAAAEISDIGRPRRSARFSISNASPDAEQTQASSSLAKEGQDKASAATSGKRKRITFPSSEAGPSGDRRSGEPASPPSSPLTDIDGPEADPPSPPLPAKRPRRSIRAKPIEQDIAETKLDKGKGKAKAPVKAKKAAMPRKNSTPKTKRGGLAGSGPARGSKGDSSLIDNDTTDEGWANESGPSRSRYMDEDEDMDESDHDHDDDDDDEDDEEEGMGGGVPAGSAFERFNQLAAQAGMHIDEDTAAALFGGSFRSMGGMMSGLNNRFKRLKTDLKSKNISTRLAALRECSEVLLVSNEDTLGGAFSTQGFATEFIAILKGKPNIDENSTDAGPSTQTMDFDDDDMDEDAQLARALAMSTEGAMPPGMGMDASEEEMECQLVACRCLAHLLEALPGTGHTLVHLGAVPVLCSKLNEPSYIELAEQTLSTMEKISAEYPSAIVREGGLEALLRYLDFFSTNVQRTAVTAAANCCRNISSEHYSQVKGIFPTLRQTLTQTDQRLVEQATLAVVRTLEAYRHNAEHLEGLLDLETVVAINALLVPSGGSPLISPSTYTHLLRSLTSSARMSAKVTIAFLEAGMTNTVYQILTGVLPPAHDEDEQGMSPGGQGLAGGVADMAVLQNLAHRPKDQVEEALALICELLPPTLKEGVFDSKAYSEKALQKLKKGGKVDRPDAPPRRSSRTINPNAEGSGTGTTTPGESAGGAGSAASGSAPALPAAIQAALKQKKEQEALNVKRLALLKEHNQLVGKFIRAILPVLVDVFAASVAARVRTKVLAALVKAIAFADSGELRRALQSVPMASFLGTIISSKDNPAFILSALQIVELLVTKLSDIYKPSVIREGVVFEIQALSQNELTTVKAAREAKEEKSADEARALVKTEPDDADAPPAASASRPGPPTAPRVRDPSFGMPGSFMAGMPLDDLKPLLSSTGMPTRLADYIMEKHADAPADAAAKKYTVLDPQDINILRARVMLAKKLFEMEDGADEGMAVLDQLGEQIQRICSPDASESQIRDALRDIAAQFTDGSRSLSSFELLQSGLIDGLVDFADVEGMVSADERKRVLYEELIDTANPAASPLVMLVKRLHESLGRLENFDVETAFNGVADTSRSSSTLSRTMRIRLQAEDGQDVPKHVAAISLTIQAVCPISQLNDYLHQRVLNGNNYLSGGASALANMLGFGSGSLLDRPGSGSGGAAGLLGALGRPSGSGTASAPAGSGSSAARGGASSLPDRGGLAAMLGLDAPTAATASGSARAEPSAAAEASNGPQRRRSARLSGAGTSGDAAAPATGGLAATGSSAPNPPSGLLSMLGTTPTGAAEGLFGGMDMDMDYDDEYSDEGDYDAEMFDDEMEEELARPQEKVVNMSVAPDGSKVEAKTPDGTRVATPSQNAPSAPAADSSTPTARPGVVPGAAAGTSASGAATPRTASYAGAVKTAPTDWHLEFTYDGKDISYDDTVYGVVHRAQADKAQAQAASANGSALPGSMGSFGATALFKYKKVPGPAPTEPAADAPSPASDGHNTSALSADMPTTKILRLLRLVHDLVADGREASEGRHGALPDESMFVNNKLTAKLTRQLEETMIVASWATVLPKHFAFLFPFETRYSFLQNNSFGYSRLIQRHQAAQSARAGNNSNRRDDLSHLARTVRQKVRISRAQLLESAAKVLELYGVGKSILEVEYFDEIGTGLGPTLEFYSLASKEFARRSLKLWRDDDEAKEGSYVFHARGLYPSPMDKEDTSRLTWYKTLGIFIGRALIDSRIIDVTLNKVFLKLILGSPVRKNIATLRGVDPVLARSLERLQAYSSARKEIEALQLPDLTKHQKLAALTVNGAQLSELALDFTLPGYNIELAAGGASIDVDDSNLDEYLELVLEKTLGSGVAEQVKAFQEGFSLIYPIKDMRIFSPEELVLLFGNADEDWSPETIEHSIKADHGYNLDSRSVRNLIEVMSSYTKEERRQFLQFITGAPKLPIGGFRGLSPPFTVVRKPHEAPFRADDYLPSVMTCAQYLKLPDYSNKEVLAKQVQRAIHDGGGSFHLS